MIRESVINDIEALKKIVVKYDPNFLTLYNLSDLINNETNHIYIYEMNKEILGFLIIEVCYETINIVALFVEEKSRRKKIASNLIDYFFSEINQNVNNIMLEVNENNHKAIELYKKFGFEVINIRKGYYKDADAYIMKKVISYE